MKPIVYVFTGTGNSLAVARDIAKKINAAVVRIDDKITPKIPAKGCAGIIFPVYGWGPPLIVKRFLNRLKAGNNAYVFSVANCAGSAGGSNGIVKNILAKNNIALSSSFIVKMPSNYIVFSGAEPNEKQTQKFSITKQKTVEIASIINSRNNHYEKGGIVLRFLGSTIIHSLFSSHIAASDKNFSADEKCNGCGICEKICPVKNITLKKKRPEWNHQCEQCLACLQWCSKEAIQYGKKSSEKSRYHHPDIRLKDMMQ